MSVQNTIKQAIKNISGPTKLSDLPGDYNEVSLAVAGTGGVGGMEDKVNFKIGNRVVDTADQVMALVRGKKISSSVQKALGQNPSDNDIDDFDDALKVIGPSNLQIVPENYNPSNPGNSGKNNSMKDSTKKTLGGSALLLGAAAVIGYMVINK